MGNQQPVIDELVGSYPVCGHCGSKKVVRDAWAKWNSVTREWELKSIFDEYVCDGCGKNDAPIWKIDKDFRQKRIRRLNDEMRVGSFKHGSVVITAGVQTLGEEWLAAITDKIGRFEDFTEDNDPHQEHDFGSLTMGDKKIFWKVDYFDLKLKWHSPDAANPDVTHRVLTIMLASEY